MTIDGAFFESRRTTISISVNLMNSNGGQYLNNILFSVLIIKRHPWRVAIDNERRKEERIETIIWKLKEEGGKAKVALVIVF